MWCAEDDSLFLHGLLEGIARIECEAYHLLHQLGGTPVTKVPHTMQLSLNGTTMCWHTCTTVNVTHNQDAMQDPEALPVSPATASTWITKVLFTLLFPYGMFYCGNYLLGCLQLCRVHSSILTFIRTLI